MLTTVHTGGSCVLYVAHIKPLVKTGPVSRPHTTLTPRIEHGRQQVGQKNALVDWCHRELKTHWENTCTLGTLQGGDVRQSPPLDNVLNFLR